VIGGLRRALVALLGGQRQPSSEPRADKSEAPSQRLDAAHQRLKQTIPPPEDD
jgi:hypothetical protein